MTEDNIKEGWFYVCFGENDVKFSFDSAGTKYICIRSKWGCTKSKYEYLGRCILGHNGESSDGDYIIILLAVKIKYDDNIISLESIEDFLGRHDNSTGEYWTEGVRRKELWGTNIVGLHSCIDHVFDHLEEMKSDGTILNYTYDTYYRLEDLDDFINRWETVELKKIQYTFPKLSSNGSIEYIFDISYKMEYNECKLNFLGRYIYDTYKLEKSLKLPKSGLSSGGTPKKNKKNTKKLNKSMVPLELHIDKIIRDIDVASKKQLELKHPGFYSKNKGCLTKYFTDLYKEKCILYGFQENSQFLSTISTSVRSMGSAYGEGGKGELAGHVIWKDDSGTLRWCAGTSKLDLEKYGKDPKNRGFTCWGIRSEYKKAGILNRLFVDENFYMVKDILSGVLPDTILPNELTQIMNSPEYLTASEMLTIYCDLKGINL